MYLLCVGRVRQTFRNQITDYGCSLKNQAGNGFSDLCVAIECNDQAGNETGNSYLQLADDVCLRMMFTLVMLCSSSNCSVIFDHGNAVFNSAGVFDLAAPCIFPIRSEIRYVSGRKQFKGLAQKPQRLSFRRRIHEERMRAWKYLNDIDISVHAAAATRHLKEFNCPTVQKLDFLNSIIETVRERRKQQSRRKA